MKKTPLHAIHTGLGAKMGEFAGYDMPLYYNEGVIKEHEWVRAHAGIFDVSHMGQIVIEGVGAAEFLEKLTPSAFQNKAPGKAQYTVLINAQGGIIDDLIVTCLDRGRFFAVVNAGCKDKDIEWIRESLPGNLRMRVMEDYALIALQGPSSEGVAREVLKTDLSDLLYMHLTEGKMPDGTEILVSRVGYTGEDGFEISVPNEKAAALWTMLSDHREVKPIGLAARDSLRLDMGYALYGHDIDQETSPVEAGLNWIIRKEPGGCLGHERIDREREEGPARRRVGFRLIEKGIAREGAEITNESGIKIGMVTSGGFSPSLKEAIGQGYVDAAHEEEGGKIRVVVRGRPIAAELAAMPFVPAKTKSMKKQKAA